MTDRAELPPRTNGLYCSPELEAGLLGTMLVLGASGRFPEYLDELVTLPADTFTSWHYPLIYGAIQRIRAEGNLVSVPTVKAHLEQVGLGKAGEKVAGCLDAARAVMANWEHVRDELRRLAHLRRVDTVLGRQLAELRAGITDSAEWMRATRDAIAGVLEPERAKLDGWPILTQEELWAPLEAPRWVIDGVLREGGVVEIVAYAGSSKSWMGDDACVAVASGQAWLRRFATVKGKTLLIDWENGSYETRRRMGLILAGRDIEPPLADLDACILPPSYLTTPGVEAQLIELAHGRSLIVIDTFRAACPGIDENDSSVRMYIDMLRRVGERTGCGFLILIHAKKTGNGDPVDPREMARGSSAILDAPDLALLLSWQGEGKPGLVQQIKARQGKPVDPFQVSLLDGDPNDPSVSVVATDVETAGGPTKRLQQVQERVEELFSGNPVQKSARAIAAKLGANRNDVADVVELLIDSGRVVSEGKTSKRVLRWVIATA